MYEDLKTGCAVIVGGSGGIGGAICRAFAAAGAPVAFTYRTGAARAEALTRELEAAGARARAIQADITAPEDARALLAAAADAFGAVRTLVFSSGPLVRFNPIADVPAEEFKAALDADVMGFFNAAQAALPCLRQSRGAIIALSTSGTARYPSLDILSAGPKASLEMLVKGLAREEGRNGVRANCIRVGQINAGQGLSMQEGERGKRIAQQALAATPLRRFGEAEDVANAALFFASDKASFVTGQCLNVDGGVSL